MTILGPIAFQLNKTSRHVRSFGGFGWHHPSSCDDVDMQDDQRRPRGAAGGGGFLGPPITKHRAGSFGAFRLLDASSNGISPAGLEDVSFKNRGSSGCKRLSLSPVGAAAPSPSPACKRRKVSQNKEKDVKNSR